MNKRISEHSTLSLATVSERPPHKKNYKIIYGNFVIAVREQDFLFFLFIETYWTTIAFLQKIAVLLKRRPK